MPFASVPVEEDGITEPFSPLQDLIEKHKLSEMDVLIHREGCRARSKALDLGSSLAGVRAFESLPSHEEFLLSHSKIEFKKFKDMLSEPLHGEN